MCTNYLYFTEVQPQIKDKSAWRKSTLNVANSTEEAKDDNFLGRYSISRLDSNGNLKLLHSISEDNDRKHLISSLGNQSNSDKLTLYIRKPTQTSPPPSDGKLSNRRAQESNTDQTVSNKVEIDQDNIETPPATRKVFTPTPVDKREPVPPTPCRRLTRNNNNDESDINSTLGDGQFDRYSATRRTRRYKRNTENLDASSPTEVVAETHIVKPAAQIEISQPISLVEPVVDKETRLKGWQEKLKSQNEPEINRTSRRYRNQTGINRDDVELALLTNSKPSLNVSTTYITAEPKIESSKIDIPTKRTKEHDNDEGFEETQSLMSESPSQGASSGGNYETDIVISDYSKSKPRRAISTESKGTIDSTTSSDTQVQSSRHLKPTSRITRTQSSTQKPNYARSLDRTNSLRTTTQDNARKSVIPRRSDSLRKSDSKTSITSNKNTSVQRSNSRNSIVSSRSSLNSATSTNTVKRVPLKPSNTNSTPIKPIQRTPSNRSINSTNKTTIKRSPSTGSTTGSTRPPRPGAMSFMKPTTSSSTKINSNLSPNRPTLFRSKN